MEAKSEASSPIKIMERPANSLHHQRPVIASPQQWARRVSRLVDQQSGRTLARCTSRFVWLALKWATMDLPDQSGNRRSTVKRLLSFRAWTTDKLFDFGLAVLFTWIVLGWGLDQPIAATAACAGMFALGHLDLNGLRFPGAPLRQKLLVSAVFLLAILNAGVIAAVLGRLGKALLAPG